MDCKECGGKLREVAEMDEYQLCHVCYCTVMDTTKKEGEKKVTDKTVKCTWCGTISTDEQIVREWDTEYCPQCGTADCLTDTNNEGNNK